MKTTVHFCLRLSILLIWLLQTSQIRANNYYFEQVALKEGLSTTVNCIYAEKNSFVWIGTRTGLGRFDGHELKKYTHSPENPAHSASYLIDSNRSMILSSSSLE